MCSRRAGFLTSVFSILFVLECASGELLAAKSFAMEEQLLLKCPKIVTELKRRNCRRVGVLKFRVLVDGEPTDRAGTINSLMADRLERALICLDDDQPLRIAKRASDTAATIPGANHLENVDGLLSRPYEMAWGEESELDGFLTGMLVPSLDWQTVDVGIMLARKDAPLERLAFFTVPADRAIRAEFGDNFGPSHRGPRKNPAGNRAADNEAALPEGQDVPKVQLVIYYGGVPIPPHLVKTINGQTFIPEPLEGQEIQMELRRQDKLPTVLGVVLKVNGENVIDHQRLPDPSCAKLILDPGCDPTVLQGFLNLEGESEEVFRVATEKESRDLETKMYYGRDVGLIQIVVFQEATVGQEQGLGGAAEDAESRRRKQELNKLDFGELDPDVALMVTAQADYPAGNSRSRSVLKRKLAEKAFGDGTRGVIRSGKARKRDVRRRHVNWDPQPVVSMVWRYRNAHNVTQ